MRPRSELTDVVEAVEWVMATVMDSVEFLNPSYEEARKRYNWPKWQNKKYKLTDLGPCKWLLGIKIERGLEN